VEDGEEQEGNYDIPPTMLTPDQEAAPYIRTMSEGPVLLLVEMSKYS
jgi:hypothetical protein